jgi:uncharacterized membrane protein YphA (DoxX/SURF4 family)
MTAATQLPSLPEQKQQPSWPLRKRLGFRFAFTYLLLYCFPSPLSSLPRASSLFDWYDKIWQKMVIFTGAHVLHLAQPVIYQPTGSGDTLHDFIQNGLFLALAIAATLVWSVLDRKRENYVYLHQWLRLYLRIYLGATLISYGSFKVIKSQFPYPYLSRLLEPYGDGSPMGLLWTFMGYSKTYNVFTGAVEMLGGALVFIPRLTTLGALTSAAAMTNVFILNMSYDVPVKLFSFNLLLISCFLLLPELRRLMDAFIFNRQVQPVLAPPLFQRKALNIGVLAVQLAFLLWSSISSLAQSYKQASEYGDLAPRPPLYGIYNVDQFLVDGVVRPPLFTDKECWRRVTFDLYSITVIPPEGPAQRYRGKFDEKAHTLELSKAADPKWKATLTLAQPSPGSVILSGEMDGRKISAMLRRVDLNSFLLNSRGFHWINELPFNR